MMRETLLQTQQRTIEEKREHNNDKKKEIREYLHESLLVSCLHLLKIISHYSGSWKNAYIQADSHNGLLKRSSERDVYIFLFN